MGRTAVVCLTIAVSAVAHLTTEECNTNSIGLPHCPTVGNQPAWVEAYSIASAGPEQLLINYGATPDIMAVRWTTNNTAASSTVEWGLAPDVYSNTVTGTAAQYRMGFGPMYTSPLIHTANLTGLPLNTTVYYRVGDAATGYSSERSFTSSPGVGATAAFFPWRTAFIADVGESAAANTTISHLVATLDTFDHVMHPGDIAYASGCEAKTGCGVWDAWGRLLDPLVSLKPYALSLGNHELLDFDLTTVATSTTYRHRGMPTGGAPLDGNTGLQYFSFNVGPLHVISFNCFYAGGFGAGSKLVQWLQADLAAVNHGRTPWIVVLQHAPWYNSNAAHQGDGESARKGLEAMLIAAGASMVVNGHVHAYERSTPVNDNRVVRPGPGGMTHLNVGDGGASLYTSWLPQPAWSAYRNATWGYGRATFVNVTHAKWEWHSDASTVPAAVSDTAWIVNSNPRAWDLVG